MTRVSFLTFRQSTNRRFTAILFTSFALLAASNAAANPEGGTVVRGSASIVRESPSKLTIKQQSNRTVINWRNFSIGGTEHTHFQQPSGGSALNRVTSRQVSSILGRLTATGKVFLVNPNGVVFGKNARVDVGALVSSIHDVRNRDFMAGRLRFTIPGRANARITNRGTISVKEGGLVALVAPSIQNSGIIYARLGRVALAAGNAVTIDPYGDDLITFEVPENVAAQLTDPDHNPAAALIDLSGDILANGGGVLITADKARSVVDNAVNMTGIVEARSLSTSGGKVILRGGSGNVTVDGTIDTSGLDGASGGEVRVTTDGSLTMTSQGRILAEGGANGGDGGFAAVSALDGPELAGHVSVKAGYENGDSGWLYAGDNVAAAETMRNPNTEGAGRVGSGANTVYFEANKGQADDSVAFIARGSNASLYLTAADAILAMATDSGTEAVRMGLSGFETMPKAVGEDRQAGVINYYHGDDEKNWVEGAPTYKQVYYRDVYEGVDLVYYGNRAGELEFDLKVRPGADPSRIALDYAGATSIRKTAKGDLVIKADKSKIVQKAPLIYQEMENANLIVPGDYRVDANNRVTIKTDQYDQKKTLVIDPIIQFSTHLGGSGDENDNAGNGQVDMDSLGNIYVTGRTTSNDFPLQSALDSTLGDPGGSDAFVSKFDSSNNLVYSTYLGGNAVDEGFGIAVDNSGNAYVTGTTASTDFPGVNAEQGAIGGGNDIFVSKLNAAGGALAYSTYLGGSGAEDGNSIAVDGSGNAYVTGTTQSADFPDQAASGFTVEQASFGGGKDAFIVKYDTTGDVRFATFLGGTQDEEGFGIAVDGSGNAYVTGKTASADFPTLDATDNSLNGTTDGFVAKYSSSGSKVYATFHGGSSDEKFNDIAVEPDGTSYLAGDTDSSDFTTLNAAQPNISVGGDAVVASYNSDGELIYSTFHGGTGFDSAASIAVDNSGNAFLTGLTTSTDLPTVAPTQAAFGGGLDAYISGFDGSGARIYSSYLGGSNSERGEGIAIDGTTMVVTGNTDGSDFPRLNAFQAGLSGSSDAFITRLDFSDILPPPPLSEAQQAALDLQISLAGRAPTEAGESTVQPPSEQPTDPASVSQTSRPGGEDGSGVIDPTVAAVRTFRSESMELASQIIQGSETLSLSEQRAVFRRLPVDQILTTLSESGANTSLDLVQTLRKVLEGRGPSFDEFSASLRLSGIAESSARALIAIFLRLADARRDVLFRIAARELADNPGIAETFRDSLQGQTSVGDFDIVSTTDTVVVSGTIFDSGEVKLVSIGNNPVTVDAGGSFQLSLTPPTANTTVLLTREDGSISERSLFSTPSRETRLFEGGGRISRDAAGNLEAEGRIADPQTIRQVFVDGRPAAINADGSFQTSIPASDAAFAVITVDRTSGIQERHKISIASQSSISDLITSKGDDGKPSIQVKLTDPAGVAAILIDGQPFEAAADGTFSFPLPEGTLTPVPVTIVHLDGSRTEEVVAVGRDVELAEVETFTTGDGLQVFEGRLKEVEGVAELRVSGQPVAISVDGTFAVRTQQEAAAPETFVTVSVVHDDGSVATRQIATNPDPLAAGIDRQTLDDGSAEIRAQIADAPNVVGVRVGDQPAEIDADGRFTIPLSPDQASQEISITVLFVDGTAKTQRIAADDKAVVSDLRPVTAPVIGEAVAGRISNPEDVAQILADGQRVAVDAEGSFLFPTTGTATENVDLTIIFSDGTRLDRRLAVREQSPFSTLETVAGVDGAPESRGKLADPEDVAEVRFDGRPVEIAADGSFSITPSDTTITENDTVAITTIHADGSRSEQRIATRPRPVISDFSPILPTDETAAAEEGFARATGAVAKPEDVAEIRIDGKKVALSEDGSFTAQISDEPVNIEDSVSITVLFKDGTRVDREMALEDTPVSTPLQTIVTPDGAAIATGSVDVSEDVAEVRVNGRTVEIADDGAFQIELAAEAGKTGENAIAQSTAGSVSITIINVDGTQREEQVSVDPSPLLTAAETVVASDGTLQLVGNLAGLEDIATVLVGDKPVTVGDDGSIEVLLDPTVVQIERSISLTIVFEDGSSRMQQVSVGTEPAFENVLAVTKEDGGSRLEGKLERSDDISLLRVGGRIVPVAEDGSFGADVLRTQGAPTGNVSVTIIYADGSRVDQKVALRDGPQVAAQDLVVAEDGGAVAKLRLAESEGVAGVRVNGRPVEVEEGGSLSLRLDGTLTLIDEMVSVTIVYADGSRLEQQVAVTQEPPITAAKTVSVSATSRFVEGQLTNVEGVAQVLVDGQPFNVNSDGRFRLDLTESGKTGESVSLTVVYADGSRKVQRLGITAETLLQNLDTFVTTDGAVATTGRIDDVEDVSQVVINGRKMPLAEDGNFEVEGSSSDTSIDQTLSVVVSYKDGARVTGQVATRSDSVLSTLDTVIDADGSSVVEGQLNSGANVASISFGGNPVSIAPDGTFRLTVSEEQIRSATQRTLKVVYTDGRKQPKNMVIRADGALQSLDTYTTRDGSAAVESTLADPETIAQVFVDGKQVELDDGGSFFFRHSTLDGNRTRKATIRIVYKDGSIAGRTVSMNTNIARPTMVITNAQQSADGSAVAEAFIANADQIADLEIGGSPVNVGAGGRIRYRVQDSQASSQTRVPVNVTYRNGLNAETWIMQGSNIGAAVPLPRQPRKVALVIGNGSYGGEISSLPTASADASLVGDMLKTRFDFKPRQLRDASKNEIMGAFQRLGRELGPNDQLAVYYAGQSYTEPRSGQSYWLPRDAKTNTARNWLSGDQVYRTLDAMGLKQVLLMADTEFNVSEMTSKLSVGKTGPKVGVVSSATGRPVQAVPGDSHSAFAWQVALELTNIEDQIPPKDLFRVIGEGLRRSGPLPFVPEASAQ